MSFERHFQPGDRVRVCNPRHEYTGCRGTIARGPKGADRCPDPLGHFVAIDGENGVLRPFLVKDLELLVPARVRRGSPLRTRAGSRGRS